MSEEHEMLFTVISDHEDGVLIEQFKAFDLRELFDLWILNSSLDINRDNIAEDDYEFASIKNTKNVWCTSTTDRDGKTIFVNVVLTNND